ncbi:AAA-ATPase At2g46620-like [Aristolochia californica]|uniref:AAA-ATPase At2g46620-like n=1 Tax=Aristolochia californica TaxID=171875 RepID=UPI0035DD0D71
MNLFTVLGAIAGGLVVFRIMFLWSVLTKFVRRWWGLMEEWCYVYQFYRIPEYNENFQENQLYRKVPVYLSSLPSLEDSDYANLFAGKKPNEIFLQLDPNQVVRDSFLGTKVSWRNESSSSRKSFVLKIRKEDKRRILRPYLQHIQTVADEIELKKREIKLYTNDGTGAVGRWRSVSFTHPVTLESIAMDADLKNKVRSDLESFVKGKQYYHRLGRVWKRSYLLYGPAGTGKTSFVAAMAKFLCYDLYEVDLGRVKADSDLKSLLLQTSGKSVILVEDLDRFLAEKSGNVSISGILNITDGVFSCCGEERVMVFTMNSRDKVDPSLLRPGRLDVHIYFPLCDFPAFKTLATSYLGVKDHKLFPQVEEVFQAGGSLSPAEIGEILIVNRSSPSRALKSIINALQSSSSAGSSVGTKTMQRLSESGSVNGRSDDSRDASAVMCRESVHTVREFRRLYGLLKMNCSGSRKNASFELDK